METFHNHSAFYNRPIHLTAAEKAGPQEVLQDFFHNCPLSDIRRLLWQLLETSLCVPDSPFDKAEERQMLLWFYRQLERTLEAALLLSEQYVCTK